MILNAPLEDVLAGVRKRNCAYAVDHNPLRRHVGLIGVALQVAALIRHLAVLCNWFKTLR